MVHYCFIKSTHAVMQEAVRFLMASNGMVLTLCIGAIGLREWFQIMDALEQTKKTRK